MAWKYHADRTVRAKRMAIHIVVDSGGTRPALKEKGESLKLNNIKHLKDDNRVR